MTLGAAARREGRPLLRPIVHGFVRGIGGAVVTFPEAADGARLWLAAEDEVGRGELDENHAHFPVMTCTTCGQHYYIAFLEDFIFAGKQPGGGEAGAGSHWWPSLEETNGGKRVVLFDRLIGASDDDGEVVPHARTASLHFCRQCGTAHPGAVSRCRSCGTAGTTVQLHAIRQRSTSPNPGTLTSCLSCGSAGHRLGGRYREPARSVRAITVSDVHVLTQDMVHHAERPRLRVSPASSITCDASAPCRPRARDLHQVLDGGRPRDPATLSAELPRAKRYQDPQRRDGEGVAGHPVAERERLENLFTCRARRQLRCGSTFPATSSTPTGIASWRAAFIATSARRTPRCRSTRSPPRSRR